MAIKKTENITNWGNYPAIDAEVLAFQSVNEAREEISRCSKIIAREMEGAMEMPLCKKPLLQQNDGINLLPLRGKMVK